jgi:hypothetical protein
MVSLDLTSKSVVCFLVESQNYDGGGFSSLGLKTSSYSLVIWASNSPRWFFSLDLKTKQATVCWLHHKNRREGNGVVHASRYSGLLGMEASWARIFQFASKLVEARRRVAHVTPSWRSREDQVEDGWVNEMSCVRPS